MAFELKTVDDLVRIAYAGGGFELDARVKTTDDLVRIAAAASGSGARLAFNGISKLRTTDEIVRIAFAGKGAVTFGE